MPAKVAPFLKCDSFYFLFNIRRHLTTFIFKFQPCHSTYSFQNISKKCRGNVNHGSTGDRSDKLEHTTGRKGGLPIIESTLLFYNLPAIVDGDIQNIIEKITDG